MSSRNIKLTIAYDGFGYHGWQVQPEQDTIQGQIQRALEKLTSQKVEIIGASRTDAGVSAIGQVANFTIDSPVPTENFANALNKILPDDITITEAIEVNPDFNARFGAVSKKYQYKICNSNEKPVLDIRHCWHYSYPLDIEKMNKAANMLVGRFDFKSFASSGDQRTDSVRTIFKSSVEPDGKFITYTVEGDGFLYNMVRNIVGTIAEIGRGRWEPEYIVDILKAKDRTVAGTLAPPQGLCLMWIKYEKSTKNA